MLQHCTPILDLDEQVVEVKFLPMGTDIFLVLSPKVSGAMAKTIIEHSIHNLVHTSLKLIVGIREMGCKFEAAQFGVELHVALVVVRVQLFFHP